MPFCGSSFFISGDETQRRSQRSFKQEDGEIAEARDLQALVTNDPGLSSASSSLADVAKGGDGAESAGLLFNDSVLVSLAAYCLNRSLS